MYELMVVANPTENAESFVKKLEGFLGEAKASSLKTERLGKKPLAYQIRKQTEGEYVLFTFDAPSDAPETVIGKLALEQDAVLRYILLRTKVAKVSKVSDVSKVESEKQAEKVTAKVEVIAKVPKTKKTSLKSAKVEGKRK